VTGLIPGAVGGVIKDLVRRSESGRLLSAANSLARVHRWNAVKSDPESTHNRIGVASKTHITAR